VTLSTCGRSCAKYISVLFWTVLIGCGTVDPTSLPRSTLDSILTSNQAGDNNVATSDSANTGPSVSFTIVPVFCCDPRSMVFTAYVSGEANPGNTVFYWDFGDGRTGVGNDIEHAYIWPGDYLVVLEADFGNGVVLVAENTLSLPGSPSAAEPMDPDEPDHFEIVVFAFAGPDRQTEAGAMVTLDGSGSYGTGTDPLNFEWRLVNGPLVALVNRLTDKLTFTAPTGIQEPTTLLFELIVAQGEAYASDQVSVIVQPPPSSNPPIRFAVTPRDGSFTTYGTPATQSGDGEVTTYDDDVCSATIRTIGGGEYELTIQAKYDLNNIWFPWSPTRYDCERIYYPHLLGLEIDNSRLQVEVWNDSESAVYPGQTAFPGAVMEGETAGRGVFATNWPPQTTYVLYSRGQVTLRYDEPLAAGQSRIYRVLVVDEHAEAGIAAWQKAIDRYKVWLREHMQDEGLWPVAYPAWLEALNGWSNVQLQDYDDPMDEVRYRWDTWGDLFPMVQTWGAMSDRYLGSNQGTGCCLIDTGLHPRNAELPALSQWITDQGGHIGHYARPRNTGPIAGSAPNADANRQWLLNWMAINRDEYHANATYLDWFIVRPLGPVLDVAFQFRDGVWGDGTVCEYSVDVYPTAFLLSGALWGGFKFNSVAGQTLETTPPGQIGLVFPRLVRYLLDDRIFFLGESNGDHVLWGAYRGAGYWGERQAFLLGCKLDWMQRPDAGGSNNPVVLAIVDAWQRSAFWDRKPVYADTVGLTDVPLGVGVRRFYGSNGESILAIDNPAGHDSVTLMVDGEPVTIDTVDSIDVVVLPD